MRFALTPILAQAELSATWGLVTLGIGALIFVYIMARLLIEYRKNR